MSEKDNWKWQKELLIKRDIEHQEEIERLNAELELYKDNQIHINNQLEQKDKIINEAIKYIENDLSLGVNTFDSVYSIGGNEVLKILQGSDKE